MKYKIFFLFFLIQISSQVKSDMTERQIFTELFNGCVKDGDPNMTLGVQFEYCACIMSNMSTGLTYDELMVFVEGREEAKINRKIGKFTKKCIEKVYQ
mgnify:FL=1|tara:strand:- start:216 stop:509 length:294 start_codon:yes stop_codon:yes gene_type:complete